MVRFADREAKTSNLKLLDFTTGKELRNLSCPEKERYFLVNSVSPDGAVVATFLMGKKGAPIEVWFLDAKTLEDRGKLVGQGDPEEHGWSEGAFTSDGKWFVAFDGIGNALVWNVAEQKMERTLPLGGNRQATHIAISPDGKTLAAGWRPKGEAEIEDAASPDPQELPQPRVTLLDLTGKTPSRILIAPHGYVGSLAFSPDGKTLAFGGAGAVHLFDLTK